MRYRGQSFELEIKKTSGDIAASFHQAHRERYGYAQESSEIEIVSARLRSSGVVERLPETSIEVSRQKKSPQPHKYVSAYFQGKKLRVGVYRREELPGGVKLRVPCIVTEYSATTLIPASARARLDRLGNLLIVTSGRE